MRTALKVLLCATLPIWFMPYAIINFFRVMLWEDVSFWVDQRWPPKEDSDGCEYLDRAGQPISKGDWLNKLDVWDYRHVALDDMPGDRIVSTVWRGTRPGLFETRTFPGHKLQRYETEAEAMAGHRAIVEEESHG